MCVGVTGQTYAGNSHNSTPLLNLSSYKTYIYTKRKDRKGKERVGR